MHANKLRTPVQARYTLHIKLAHANKYTIVLGHDNNHDNHAFITEFEQVKCQYIDDTHCMLNNQEADMHGMTLCMLVHHMKRGGEGGGGGGLCAGVAAWPGCLLPLV